MVQAFNPKARIFATTNAGLAIVEVTGTGLYDVGSSSCSSGSIWMRAR